MLRGETHPKEICVTILITCAPLLQLHPWLISFSPFKFISNDLYATKLGQVWREVSSSVNCFRQWCAANSESYLNRTYCDSFALSISLYFLLSFSVWLFLLLCFSDTPSTVSHMSDLLRGTFGLSQSRLITKYTNILKTILHNMTNHYDSSSVEEDGYSIKISVIKTFCVSSDLAHIQLNIIHVLDFSLINCRLVWYAAIVCIQICSDSKYIWFLRSQFPCCLTEFQTFLELYIS